MNSSEYWLAALPDPWTICGLRLRPFSLGHVILLHRFENGFVIPDREPTNLDLLIGLLICSRDYEQGITLMNDPSLLKATARWQFRLEWSHWWKFLCRSISRFDWAQKSKDFAEYLRLGSTHPHYLYTPNTGDPVDLPLAQMLKVWLMTKTHLTESEILNRPYGLCLWDWLTILANEGRIRIMDRERFQFSMNEEVNSNGTSTN